VRAGDAFWNPLSGEKALVVESTAETGGARFVFDWAVEAGGFVSGGPHIHDHADERFAVKAGRISGQIAGEERTLAAGDDFTVPAGTWHHWRNAEEEEVVIRVTVEPALRSEEAVATAWGLSADGHTTAEGRPSPLLGALLATKYRPEIRFRQPPDFLQRLLFPPLARLARRRGLELTLARYVDAETHPAAEAGAGRLPERLVRV
jgi:quercetin dioxygenase-like cupin family protein